MNLHRHGLRLRAFVVLAGLSALPLRAGEGPVLADLKEAGGQVIFDKDGTLRALFFKDSSGITRRLWREIGGLKDVKQITLYNRCTLNDESLPELAGLTNLEQFAVDGARLTDQGMAGFSAWKNLRRITFFHVFWGPENFKGTGLSVFATLPHLESFGMGGSTLTDDGLGALATATQLQDLHIWHTLVTDAGTAHLERLSKLRRLKLAPQFNARITDACLPHIAALTDLETLSLGETRLSYDGGLNRLKALPNLKALELDRIEISDADLARLRADLPGVAIKRTAPTEKEQESLRRSFAARK